MLIGFREENGKYFSIVKLEKENGEQPTFWEDGPYKTEGEALAAGKHKVEQVLQNANMTGRWENIQ